MIGRYPAFFMGTIADLSRKRYNEAGIFFAVGNAGDIGMISYKISKNGNTDYKNR